LLGPDSVSWKIFKNPLGLYIGGIAAVVLQLAEPRVAAACGNTQPFGSALSSACSVPGTLR
jgi:uncharacterized protein (DUF2236 family)